MGANPSSKYPIIITMEREYTKTVLSVKASRKVVKKETRELKSQGRITKQQARIRRKIQGSKRKRKEKEKISHDKIVKNSKWQVKWLNSRIPLLNHHPLLIFQKEQHVDFKSPNKTLYYRKLKAHERHKINSHNLQQGEIKISKSIKNER